jgi:uncharacterized MAPEG superfamily protein
MTYAYWYLFIAFLLPYVFTVMAKAAAPGYDNAKPREFLENLEGWRKRSHWVQLNSFEIFPPFAAAVIIAHQLHVNQAHIDLVALTFLGFRIMYGLFYIANKPSLRTLSFLGSLFAIIGLFMICV